MPQQQLDFYKDLAIIFGGIVALITLVSSVAEYNRQGKVKRAENFIHMRRRFLETQLFREILNLLATDDDKLCHIPVQDRRNFVGFLEEVALMVNSGMIRIDVAHYMFGYYVLLADRSAHLWHELDKPGLYWTVFRNFASKIQTLDKQGAGKLTELEF